MELCPFLLPDTLFLLLLLFGNNMFPCRSCFVVPIHTTRPRKWGGRGENRKIRPASELLQGYVGKIRCVCISLLFCSVGISVIRGQALEWSNNRQIGLFHQLSSQAKVSSFPSFTSLLHIYLSGHGWIVDVPLHIVAVA